MTADPFRIRVLVPGFEAQVERFRIERAAAIEDPALDWLVPLPYGSDPAQEVLVALRRRPVPIRYELPDLRGRI